MKWINYHHLIYFKEIAAKGSISKASQSLKVGQPALSSQLKNLEEYLGVQLFERKKRKLHLTEAGQVALDYASKISSLGQELIEVIDDKSFTKELHLSVGALDSIPKHLICDIVDFAHKKTNSFLSIYEDTATGLLNKLLGHKLDLVISDHEISNYLHKDIFSKCILKKPIYAYASPKFTYLDDDFPFSLNNTPCIVPTLHSKIRNEVDQYFHTQKIKPKLITETQDTAIQKILATRGEGVIFLPEFTTIDLLHDESLVKIGKLADVHVEYYLIYGKRMIENPAIRLILNQDFETLLPG
ncbi:MAG: LysR family transcriptional regulator [Halobacteriovoraceae bacterium]|nr:LysR family transcriptional regulator [Halobacteriovoraceae bacterium]